MSDAQLAAEVAALDRLSRRAALAEAVDTRGLDLYRRAHHTNDDAADRAAARYTRYEYWLCGGELDRHRFHAEDDRSEALGCIKAGAVDSSARSWINTALWAKLAQYAPCWSALLQDRYPQPW